MPSCNVCIVILHHKWTTKFEIFASFASVLDRWWVGEWQKCSASCGSTGQTKRTVLCIQAVSVEEQKALQSSECEHIPKPESLSSCNTHIPCPADWTAGGWSKVSFGWNKRFWFVLDCAVLNKNANCSSC